MASTNMTTRQVIQELLKAEDLDKPCTVKIVHRKPSNEDGIGSMTFYQTAEVSRINLFSFRADGAMIVIEQNDIEISPKFS